MTIMRKSWMIPGKATAGQRNAHVRRRMPATDLQRLYNFFRRIGACRDEWQNRERSISSSRESRAGGEQRGSGVQETQLSPSKGACISGSSEVVMSESFLIASTDRATARLESVTASTSVRSPTDAGDSDAAGGGGGGRVSAPRPTAASPCRPGVPAAA
ncbi:uncharacterized protein AMSG_12012 [Thecamonas trahens ATCC 50062]|uniref:Uncharacterized protein n=1 Tax=Thecamonas trahens ATCC 50062 TaxID=461836 RepID=A0A0L0DEU1_THETB|nr:hypothetical protein AMSG_12012 [Thecamonas trahens ATCC 50062]KNC50852.1 hypothetical protein AMSG_12012 [Thecamonas trahens ATCC 50062]|eukprot:XP_013756834.1 hypothetical protein AMSG_12012 [Thecamonas trahens ATCC 50062]